MVWGPGTFGYSPSRLAAFKSSECPLLNLSKVQFDTANHGRPGGDNFGEGELDTRMTAAFGLNATTLVSNTNASSFHRGGRRLRPRLPRFCHRPRSRDPPARSLALAGVAVGLLVRSSVREAAAEEGVTKESCEAYLQTQRQVCMFTSVAQVGAINRALQALGLRGVSVLGASGDGGSHWSFGPFPGIGGCARAQQGGVRVDVPDLPVAVAVHDLGRQVPLGGGAVPDYDAAGRVVGRGRRLRVAVPAAGTAPGGRRRRLPRLDGGAAAGGVVQRDGGGVPRHRRRLGRGHVAVVANVRGHLHAAHRRAPQRRLPPLGFLGPRIWQVAATHPGEAFEDITEGNLEDELRQRAPGDERVGPGDRLGAARVGSSATLRRRLEYVYYHTPAWLRSGSRGTRASSAPTRGSAC